MTTISIRMDDDEKRELEQICSDMGMNITTFFMIYTKKVLRDRRIPFEISAPYDSFYSDTNVNHLKKVDDLCKNGTGHRIEVTMEELETLADE
ncbi:MAG: type II toxin-antitoxin system RelB/DinJ family antitoxin [Lachnospiraceae bacterium]|nr:type II toxin-antitoxin system RelB/DinJ family antitoxin [Lachnospiraceae bacterium]